MRPEKLGQSFKVTQQVSGRARMQTKQGRCPSLRSYNQAEERERVVRCHSQEKWAAVIWGHLTEKHLIYGNSESWACFDTEPRT